MPGFSIDKLGSGQQIVYADNVDFTGDGSNDVEARVTTNGQLLIGSTASPHIKVGTLTSLGNTLAITQGSGTINLDLIGGNPDLHVAKLIVNSTVGAGGNYTTITAALAAAVSGDTIFVMPGSTGIYTENLTLKAGVNICAFDCDALTPNVTIIGKMTAGFAGTCTLSGLRFQTNSDFILVLSGANTTVVKMFSCYINATNNSAFSLTNSVSGTLTLISCFGNLGTTGINWFTATNSNIISFLQCQMLNSGSSITASTIANGELNLINTFIVGSFVTTGTNSLTCTYSDLRMGAGLNQICFTVGGSGTNYVRWSNLESGTASCVSVSTTVNVIGSTISSTNTNTISGAGTVNYGNLNFSNTSSLINTTTQVPIISSNDALKITTPGAYPYTTVPQDDIILVDSSVARSIVPLASPTTGQKHVIKDNAGTAGANNITVTPSGKNIDGSANFIINTNYGSINIVYSGTQWLVY